MARFYYLFLILGTLFIACKPEAEFDEDFVKAQLHGGSEKAWLVPIEYAGRPCADARPDTGIAVFKVDGTVDIQLFSSFSASVPDCQRLINYEIKEVEASRAGTQVYLDLIAPDLSGGTNTSSYLIKIMDNGNYMTMNNGSKVLKAYAINQFNQNPIINPPNCFNGIQDEDETNVDCGGSCSPCSQLSLTSLSAGTFDGAKLYLLDGSNASIQVVSTNGESVGSISGLNSPTDISASPKGLYVLDKGDSRLKLYNTASLNPTLISSSTTLPPGAIAMTVVPGFLPTDGDTIFVAYQSTAAQFTLGRIIYNGNSWSNNLTIASSIAGQCQSIKSFHIGKLLIGITSASPVTNKTIVYSSQGAVFNSLSSIDAMVSSAEVPALNSVYFIYSNTPVLRRNLYTADSGIISNFNELEVANFTSSGSTIPFPSNASEVIVGVNELYILDSSRKKVLVFDLNLSFKRQF